jgi:gluconolactonase
VTVLCAEHNHPLNDELNDKGMPPRARTTPAKATRALASSADRSFEPSGDQQFPMQNTFPPAMSAWPTVTASGIKRTVVSMQQRLLSTSRTQFPLDEPMFLVYNDKFNEMLGANADLKLALQDSFPFAHEAGVYFPKGDFVYVTSNQFDLPTRQEKVIVVSKLTRTLYGEWSRHQVPQEVRMPSGGVYYNDGILDGVLFCSQGDFETPAALIQMETDYPFRVRTLLNNYHGRRFNSLKDVAMHSDGSIWFTDPVYGFDQGIRPQPELPNQVYRFDPHTGDVRVMADGFGRPSGICFSPYEKVCYVSDTDFIHGNGNIDFTRASTIYAYDVEDRRKSKFLLNRRVFAMADVGVPDGLKCDTAGNVYAGCGDGLSIWSPGGVLLGKILVPGGLANFTFGKKGEIFLLNGKKFWVLKVADTVKGATLNRDAVQHEEPSDEE